MDKSVLAYEQAMEKLSNSEQQKICFEILLELRKVLKPYPYPANSLENEHRKQIFSWLALIEEKGTSSFFYLVQGMFYERTGQYQKAFTSYQSSINAHPYQWHAYFYAANLGYLVRDKVEGRKFLTEAKDALKSFSEIETLNHRVLLTYQNLKGVLFPKLKPKVSFKTPHYRFYTGEAPVALIVNAKQHYRKKW
jgi:tetratricopeptide (TPR) repeat protein